MHANGTSAALLIAALIATGPARAQSAVEGFGPDLQIAGGVGVGLRQRLDNPFLARVRLGGLVAFEPHWLSAGVTLEVGALSELAVGGEVELNRFNGFFVNAGIKHAKHERLTTHLGAGYMIFAAEWQHAFESPRPTDALLLTVRFPLGFWWFTSGRQERPFAPTAPSPSSSPPRPPQPSAAAAPKPVLAPPTSDATAWLRTADAELERGKLALAYEALTKFLTFAATPEELAMKPDVAARRDALVPRLARLRVTFATPSSTIRLKLDGADRPELALGYDVFLDAGPHVLAVEGEPPAPIEHPFEARPGELTRIELPLSAATAPGSP